MATKEMTSEQIRRKNIIDLRFKALAAVKSLAKEHEFEFFGWAMRRYLSEKSAEKATRKEIKRLEDQLAKVKSRRV